jgi:hypothetical protein
MPIAALLAITIAALQQFPRTPPETVIRLAVQPMGAPKPALRYLLLPELKEMSPGNPIEAYLACLLDQDFTADRETLPKHALRQVDRAARLDKPDWQILLKARQDGFGLLLPDVQKMRMMATGLQERFRTKAAQGRFEDAVATAKTMFALSRHLGEHPTLIGQLVGIAIAHVTVGPFEEMLAQPGCPNFYWALTKLPDPLISLDRGIEGERQMLETELRDLIDTAPMTPAQIKKVVEHIDYLLQFDESGGGKGRARKFLDRRMKDPVEMTAARNHLIEYGLSEERVQSFPAEQIVLLDEKLKWEITRDEMFKALKLPTWQAMKLVTDSSKVFRADKDSNLFYSLTPFIEKVRLAQGRLEQRIALLRHIEAIRLYAAEHQGQLPARLADISVPLPVDPFTGKPIRYELVEGVAHLRGTPPVGIENVAAYNLHYEITIKQ